MWKVCLLFLLRNGRNFLAISVPLTEEISDCNNIHYSHKLLQNSYFPGLRILNLICNQSLFLTAHVPQCGLPVVVGKCLCPMQSFGIQFFKINFY